MRRGKAVSRLIEDKIDRCIMSCTMSHKMLMNEMPWLHWGLNIETLNVKRYATSEIGGRIWLWEVFLKMFCGLRLPAEEIFVLSCACSAKSAMCPDSVCHLEWWVSLAPAELPSAFHCREFFNLVWSSKFLYSFGVYARYLFFWWKSKKLSTRYNITLDYQIHSVRAACMMASAQGNCATCFMWTALMRKWKWCACELNITGPLFTPSGMHKFLVEPFQSCKNRTNRFMQHFWYAFEHKIRVCIRIMNWKFSLSKRVERNLTF